MKIKPNIFVTADTHFEHSKLWDTWKHREEGFEDELWQAWNSVIGKHDVVLHLGDLSLANKERTFNWTKRLKGRKYLILGNHDRNSVTWYADCGFTVIPNAYQRFGQKDGSYIHILFTHEPVQNLPTGWFNIHGHLHGDNHRGIETTKRHFDVGVDAVGYKPLKLSSILATFKEDYVK